MSELKLWCLVLYSNGGQSHWSPEFETKAEAQALFDQVVEHVAAGRPGLVILEDGTAINPAAMIAMRVASNTYYESDEEGDDDQ
jgi:hypothetical protein